MTHGMTQYQAQRHPIVAGLVLLLLGPYLLAFAALFVVAYIVAAILDATLGKR